MNTQHSHEREKKKLVGGIEKPLINSFVESMHRFEYSNLVICISPIMYSLHMYPDGTAQILLITNKD